MRLSLDRFLKILIFVTGIALVFITPPFQAPDENNHFYRVNQIANGEMYGTVDTVRMQMGQYLPQSLEKINEPFKNLPFHLKNKTSLNDILKGFSVPLEKEIKVFFSYPNTARYAPLAYLPQVPVVFVAKILNFHPLVTLYLTRLATFLFWFMCLLWMLRITPVYRYILLCLSALPTPIAIAASVSADVLTNGLLFVAFAYFFRMKFSKTDAHPNDKYIFSALILITTWCKICYFPILFLLVLVHKNNFRASLKRKYAFIAVNLLLNLALIFWWNGKVHHLIYPKTTFTQNTYGDMCINECSETCTDPDLQMKFILSDAPKFLKEFIPVTFQTYKESYGTYIAAYGWEGKGVPNGLGLVFVILFLFLFAGTVEENFSDFEIIWLFLLAQSMIGLFILSQYLHWQGVGDNISGSYLGKYYVPVYPLILWGIISIFKFKLKFRFFDVLIEVFYLIIWIDFLILIFQRYYF